MRHPVDNGSYETCDRRATKLPRFEVFDSEAECAPASRSQYNLQRVRRRSADVDQVNEL